MTIKDLKKKAYKVYSKNMGAFIRVGAYVYAADSAELESEKDKLKKNYPINLWVLKGK